MNCIDQHEDTADGNDKSKPTNSDLKLQTDAQGYPVLPSWESIKDADLIHKKYLIGRYLTEMYRA